MHDSGRRKVAQAESDITILNCIIKQGCREGLWQMRACGHAYLSSMPSVAARVSILLLVTGALDGVGPRLLSSWGKSPIFRLEQL